MGDDTVLFAPALSGDALDLEGTWHVEGNGEVRLEGGDIAITANPAVVLWIRQDFPESMQLRFDLWFSSNRGIGVFFVAARGTEGEDIIDDQPPRTGDYGEYTMGRINCVGFSLHRFFPDGRHNPGANIRKNPGFNLVSQAKPDPIQQERTPCRVVIRKEGARFRLWVNDVLQHDWTDDGSLGPVAGSGKIGFRLAADPTCEMRVSNVEVTGV